MRNAFVSLGMLMILGGAVILSGCDGTGANAVGAIPRQPEQAGETAPDFTLEDLKGTSISLRADGNVAEPTLLVFWATWCPACRHEVPAVEAFYRAQAGNGVRVLSLSVDQDGRNVPEFVKEYGISYPVLLDKDGSVARRYGVRGIPSVIVVDRNGIIRHKSHSVEEAAEVIEGLLADRT